MAKASGSSILIVPATSYELGSSSGKKPKTPKKSAFVCGTPGADDVGTFYDPRNFLVKGGHRAFEQKIMSMNKSAIQELRTANGVLADELVKARSISDQAREQLRDKDASIEALQATVERLEKARRLVDKKHLLQLKELNRRYKEEQTQRLALESECTQLRAGKEVVNQQVEGLQEERAQLLDMLNGQRSNASRLEATIAADAATIAELRSRMQAAEARLTDEVTARQELFARHKALEADLKLVSERHSSLTASSSETESKLRGATARVQLLEDELEAAKAALQAEKAAFNSERQRVASLQSDLTQLQSTSQLAAAAAASDQAELERLRGQTEQLMTSNDSLRGEVARLREEVLHLTAQSVAAQASAQSLQQQRDDLVLQRDELQQQLVAAREAAERHERSLREEAASRLRAAQEEAAAVQRGLNEELAAKQRAWETQMRSREKAWEEERLAMERVHEEESARKDMELLEVRERMRDAQSSVAELAAEVSTFKFQGEHYNEVYKENEELQQRLAKAEESIAARDASLAEAAASHAAQLELWKSEANEVAQAAAKWKQRCTSQQEQLEAKEAEVEAAQAELKSLTGRLSASEAERVKLQETVAATESKLALATQEANSYRMQLSDALASHHGAARQMEATQQDLHLRDVQLSKLSQSLAEEASRAAQLRHELSMAIAQHAKEMDAKRRALDDLTDQLHEAERSRVVAQAEADQLRDRVALLTREVGRARALAEAAGAGRKAAGGGAAAALRQSREDTLWSQRGPGRGRGGVGGAAQRQAAAERGLEDEEEDDVVKRPYGGRGGAGRRHEYDVASLEEEAESWFMSLDDDRAPRDKGPGRETGATSRPSVVSRPADPNPDAYEAGARERRQPRPQQEQRQEAAADARNTSAAAPGPVARAYDVTISPKQGDPLPDRMDAGPAPSLALPPQPYRQQQQAQQSLAAAPHPVVVQTGASGTVSAGGAAAAAAAAYTALVTPMAPGSVSGYTAHVAAAPTPHAAPLRQHASTGGSALTTPFSAPRYVPQQAYRSYGVSLGQPHQQPQPQQQPGAGYSGYGGRADQARQYGAATPFSPALSETASNTSSNLQERLQRLLGTGKLA